MISSVIIKNSENLQVTKIKVYYKGNFLTSTHFSYKAAFTRYGMELNCLYGKAYLLFYCSIELTFFDKKGSFEKCQNRENRRAITDSNILGFTSSDATLKSPRKFYSNIND